MCNAWVCKRKTPKFTKLQRKEISNHEGFIHILFCEQTQKSQITTEIISVD